ncbi:MAG TPA: hypothetical protein EYQ54_04000 [Myxococcales bacterium]|nr:hypothetical protein [Myxococcales bacterium]
MSDKAKIALELGISRQNILMDCHELHAEIFDLESGEVWQSRGSVEREIYDSWKLPPNFVKVGIAVGVMDTHYFRRSPGAESDGPVTERDFAGHAFIHCANPPKGGPEFPVGKDPKLLRVDKHHSLIFSAGAKFQVIRLSDGADFVQVIAATPLGGGLFQPEASPPGELDFRLPEGWTLRTEKVTRDTIIHLPHPTLAWFFKDGSSFQGPVDLATAS